MPSSLLTNLGALGCAALLAACGGEATPRGPATGPTAAPATSPPSGLDALEARLQRATSIRIHAVLGSDGALQTRLSGDEVLASNNRVRVVFDGTVGGRQVAARLFSDGSTMRGGDLHAPFRFDTPPSLRDGLEVVLLRMGMLHNVERLSRSQPPEGIDGKARTWLTNTNFDHQAGEPIRGAATERYTFMLSMDRKRGAADVVLWLDSSTSLPVRRDLVVHFPEGDMRVREEYLSFVLDGPVDDAEFRGP
jgi:hypothetical protein